MIDEKIPARQRPFIPLLVAGKQVVWVCGYRTDERVQPHPESNMGNGYAIHGTNQPQTVGRAVSHGCVRMRNPDIAELYAMVPVGTPVYIY
jgi:hypothetical protein